MEMERALQRAKRKQLMKTIGIACIVTCVALVIAYKGMTHFTKKQYERLDESLFLRHAVMEPNVTINSQTINSSDLFGGTIVTHRSKEVNGYLVPWGTIESPFTWLISSVDTTALTSGDAGTDTVGYSYDRPSKQKVATFYHPDVATYHYDVPNDLKAVSQMDGYSAEVALSFTKPVRYKDVVAMIPEESLTIDWVYAFSEPRQADRDGMNGYVAEEPYGFHVAADDPTASLHSFVEALEQWNEKRDDEVVRTYVKRVNDQPIDDVEVLGVTVSGQGPAFQALLDEPLIRAASVGVTVEHVPYIEPKK